MNTGIPATCKCDHLPCQAVCLLPAFPSSLPVGGMLQGPFLLVFPSALPPLPGSASFSPPSYKEVLSWCAQLFPRKAFSTCGQLIAMVWLNWRLLTVRYISANCKHPREMSSAAQVPPRTNEEVLALSTDGSSQLWQAPTLG